MLRRICFAAPAALAVGQANAAYLRAAGIQADRIGAGPPRPVDISVFRPAALPLSVRRRPGRHKSLALTQAPVVLFAGKVEPKSGRSILSKPFSRLDHPSAVFGAGGRRALGV